MAIVPFDLTSKYMELKKAIFQVDCKDQSVGATICKVHYFLKNKLYPSTQKADSERYIDQSVCMSLGLKLRCGAKDWVSNWASFSGNPFKR